MAQQNRLDLARLNAKAAQLHLRIRAPHKLQNPVPAPASHIPRAVHPAARRPIRVRNKPLRSQPRTTEIATRQARTGNVNLPRHPRRHRLQIPVQHIYPRVPDRTPNRERDGQSIVFDGKSLARNDSASPLAHNDYEPCRAIASGQVAQTSISP